MSRITTTTIAVAADYADAMMTARQAKNWLFLLLLFLLLSQLGIFLAARFAPNLGITASSASVTAVQPATSVSDTRPVEVAEVETDSVTVTPPVSTPGPTVAPVPAKSGVLINVLEYVVGLSSFLSIVLSILLALVLLLVVMIMLVGRLIGVSHVTSAFIWCLLLTLLLFPWQAFLDPYSFKLPGVIYTWGELQGANFSNLKSPELILKWARFVGFPVAALFILLLVQIKSSRGLKFALGESDVQVEVSTPTL